MISVVDLHVFNRFGGKLERSENPALAGEEYSGSLGWLDFHARMGVYPAVSGDPTIARWHVPDPLAERYGSFSPYSYCLGNPVNFIDPSGMLTLTGEAAQDFFGWLKSNLHAGIDEIDRNASFYAGGDGGGISGDGDGDGAASGYFVSTWKVIGVVKTDKSLQEEGITYIIKKIWVWIPQFEGISPTGDKFYLANGTLLWNTNMKGEPNRVLVFEPEGNQNWKSIVKAQNGDAGALLTRMRQLSKEWSFFTPDANSNYLTVCPPPENTVLMFLMNFAEGFAIGASRGNSINTYNNTGLDNHYNTLNDLNFSRNFWMDDYTTKNFDPWW